jgi:hypothetical protein
LQKNAEFCYFRGAFKSFLFPHAALSKSAYITPLTTLMGENMINRLVRMAVLAGVYILAFLSWGEAAATKIKMGIIGNSVTMPEKQNPWPKFLQPMLADKYEIHNKAVIGRTVIAVGWKGDQNKWPYVTTEAWKELFELKPHVIPIMLGNNDSKPIHWEESEGKDRFKSDYLNMIDTLLTIKAEPFSGDIQITPKIILLFPTHIPESNRAKNGCWNKYPHLICDSIITGNIIPIIREIAEERNLDTINTNNVFKEEPEMFRDGLHLTDKGSEKMAEFLLPFFEAIEKEDFVGCMDTTYMEYSGKATTNDPGKCVTKKPAALFSKAEPGLVIRQTPAGITVYSEQRAEIRLFDLKGNILRQNLPTSGGTSTLGTEKLPLGVYMLRIASERDILMKLVLTGD